MDESTRRGVGKEYIDDDHLIRSQMATFTTFQSQIPEDNFDETPIPEKLVLGICLALRAVPKAAIGHVMSKTFPDPSTTADLIPGSHKHDISKAVQFKNWWYYSLRRIVSDMAAFLPQELNVPLIQTESVSTVHAMICQLQE
jgi:hypothetical protein